MPAPKKRPEREGIMLAYPVDEGRVSRLGESFFVQPKLNGERMVVEWFHDEPVLLSSYGNEIKFLDHIKKALSEISEELGPVPFDGELYIHGYAREVIDSIVRQKKKAHADVQLMEYHIFDLADESVNQMKRLAALRVIGHKLFKPPLKLVYTAVSDQDGWMDAAEHFVDLRYEGIILRHKEGKWAPRRTVHMLKFKPTEEDNYIISGVNEAIDQYGHSKGMVGSFIVHSPTFTQEFKVGAGKLSHKKRREYWERKTELYGKILRVKHEKIKTSGGIPICSVAVSVIGL